MDAAAALNEIAFWLERERATTYKVQAFRKAANVAVREVQESQDEAQAGTG